jgi:hypothetical protein
MSSSPENILRAAVQAALDALMTYGPPPRMPAGDARQLRDMLREALKAD